MQAVAPDSAASWRCTALRRRQTAHRRRVPFSRAEAHRRRTGGVPAAYRRGATCARSCWFRTGDRSHTDLRGGGSIVASIGLDGLHVGSPAPPRHRRGDGGGTGSVGARVSAGDLTVEAAEKAAAEAAGHDRARPPACRSTSPTRRATWPSCPPPTTSPHRPPTASTTSSSATSPTASANRPCSASSTTCSATATSSSTPAQISSACPGPPSPPTSPPTYDEQPDDEPPTPAHDAGGQSTPNCRPVAKRPEPKGCLLAVDPAAQATLDPAC